MKKIKLFILLDIKIFNLKKSLRLSGLLFLPKHGKIFLQE